MHLVIIYLFSVVVSNFFSFSALFAHICFSIIRSPSPTTTITMKTKQTSEYYMYEIKINTQSPRRKKKQNKIKSQSPALHHIHHEPITNCFICLFARFYVCCWLLKSTQIPLTRKWFGMSL